MSQEVSKIKIDDNYFDIKDDYSRKQIQKIKSFLRLNIVNKTQLEQSDYSILKGEKGDKGDQGDTGASLKIKVLQDMPSSSSLQEGTLYLITGE